jgi:nucleoid-associated protein YejK
MKKRYAEDLAKDYDFETKEEYCQYIVDNLINGNRSSVKELFNQMKGEDQEYFLIDFLDTSQGYQLSTQNICIGELCK